MTEIYHDMLQEIFDLLITDEQLALLNSQGGIKPYQMPETYAGDTRVIIDPLGSPDSILGSDTPLSKKFVYQINVESTDRKQCKILQNKIEKLLLTIGFSQMSGGLDEYFEATKRYVDARRYIGYSKLYENY